VSSGPVNSAEDVFTDPYVEARAMLMPVDDPEVWSYRFARTPPHLSAAPTLPAEPAPDLGADSRSVHENLLGYSPVEVDKLADEGAVEIAS